MKRFASTYSACAPSSYALLVTAFFLSVHLCGNAFIIGRNTPRAAISPSRSAQRDTRPNILWITFEDASPELGCYGDKMARTPNADKLATEGVRFTNAFSTAPVCAPSRSTIIAGMYASSIGSEHMRSLAVPPPQVKCFTEYLRAAGYYCTNNAKTDYNFGETITESVTAAPLTAWDENGTKAHWRGRASGQPFFSVFNLLVTHESRLIMNDEQFAKEIARLKPEDRHDPMKMQLPPYYPDTARVRATVARYYDMMTAMDYQLGDLLKQLEEDGLADNTIIFFFSDHGRCLPRGKRWLYDSGVRVPFIVRWQGKIKPASVRDDLISFIDLAPTVLALAGVKIPAHFQGQIFLGAKAAGSRKAVFFHRDRMDEVPDTIRAMRDRRFKYIRNFHPEKPYAQVIPYAEQIPMMQEWRRLNAEGQLKGAQKLFFQPTKPEEELYDTLADPHEINNLAALPQYQKRLKLMRESVLRWMKETGDTGLLPEDELQARMRPGGIWQVTAEPVIKRVTSSGGSDTVEISCRTQGASIAYTTDEGSNARWKLYKGPMSVKPNTVIKAKACRIGYKNSQEVQMRIER